MEHVLAKRALSIVLAAAVAVAAPAAAHPTSRAAWLCAAATWHQAHRVGIRVGGADLLQVTLLCSLLLSLGRHWLQATPGQPHFGMPWTAHDTQAIPPSESAGASAQMKGPVVRCG